MSKLASLMIKISANGAQAEAQIKALEMKMEGFGKRMTSLGNTLTKTLTLPLTALGGLSIKAADTQLKAEAKLLTALKQRTDVQRRLIAQATELQKKTLFGDEEIINQQAYLAALGLTEQQIADTINAAVELSAALGMELDSAVKNLAKTYGGLTGELGESIPALKELTAEQLKQGAAVDYVNANYKGFADQVAKTGAGPLQRTINKLSDMAEKLGTALLPVINKLAEWLGKLADWFNQLSPATQEIIASFVAFAAAIGPVLTLGGKLLTLIPLIGRAFSTTAGPIAVLISTLTALVAAIGLAEGTIDKQAERDAEIAKAVEQYGIVDEIKEAAFRTAYNAGYDALMVRAKDPASAKKFRDDEQMRFISEGSGGKRYTREEGMERLDDLAYWKGVDAAYKDFIKNEEERSAIQKATNQDVKEFTAELGIIGKLQERINKLQENMPFLKTEEDIAAANDELTRLNAEMERYNKLSNVAGGSSSSLTAERIATNAPVWGVGGPAQSDLDMNHMIGIWAKRREELARQVEATKTLSEGISGALNAIFANTAVAIGEGLGALITGEEFDPLKKVLGIFAELLKELGAALIAYGGALEAFKLAIKSMNPWVALGAGVALIAAGTAVGAMANKPIKLAKGGLAYGPTLAVVGDNAGAAHDPEVIAPLSKLRDYVGGQRLELVGDVTFELSGDTMRAVLGRENIRLSTLG